MKSKLSKAPLAMIIFVRGNEVTKFVAKSNPRDDARLKLLKKSPNLPMVDVLASPLASTCLTFICMIATVISNEMRMNFARIVILVCFELEPFTRM